LRPQVDLLTSRIDHLVAAMPEAQAPELGDRPPPDGYRLFSGVLEKFQNRRPDGADSRRTR
jgi:hypothetical protein